MEQNKQKRHLKKMAQFLDIPKDIVLDLPKVTMIGNIQVYIENHRGLIEYNSNLIRVSVNLGEIEIQGEDIKIRNITRDEIYVDGQIASLSYNR